MFPLALLALASLQETNPASPIEIAAGLEATELTVGETYSIGVDVFLGEGTKVAGGGLPELLLQIDPAPSIRLAGPYLETYDQLAKNEFLVQPYERLFEGTTAHVDFELAAEPAAGETIGLIVVGYVQPPGDAAPFFLRRRMELALEAGAWAERGDDTDSSWGADEDLLQIGDPLPDYELPTLDGLSIQTSQYRGDAPLFLTTYRAFW
jgi:hypothetical protein